MTKIPDAAAGKLGRPEGFEQWQPTGFVAAVVVDGVSQPWPAVGFEYRGLILHQGGGLPPRWSITHRNSGHQVFAWQSGPVRAFRVATDLADSAEWDWSGVEGWSNREPLLPIKVKAWAQRNNLPYRDPVEADAHRQDRELAAHIARTVDG